MFDMNPQVLLTVCSQELNRLADQTAPSECIILVCGTRQAAAVVIKEPKSRGCKRTEASFLPGGAVRVGASRAMLLPLRLGDPGAFDLW